MHDESKDINDICSHELEEGLNMVGNAFYSVNGSELGYRSITHKLSSWILTHLPAHRIYTEAFCGSASVLMHKPRSYAEIINDLDSEIVSVFRVMRDPVMAKTLTDASSRKLSNAFFIIIS